MRPNKIKKMMRGGEPIINGWLQIPSSFSAEVMSNQGWDSITIDMQHGVIDYPSALQMLQAISTTDVTPLARVNWNEPGQITPSHPASKIFIICPGSFQFTLAKGVTSVDEIDCSICNAFG